MKYKIYSKANHIESIMSDDGRTFNPKQWITLQGFGDTIPNCCFKLPAPVAFKFIKDLVDIDVEITVKVTQKKKK